MNLLWSDYEKFIVYYSQKEKIPTLDPEDIAQELRLHLWLNQEKFNPLKSSPLTFVINVIKRKIIDLKRTVYMQKRVIHVFSTPMSRFLNNDGEYHIKTNKGFENGI